MNDPKLRENMFGLISKILLLFLFGVSSLTLALFASNAFHNIDSDMNNICETMIALSYLNMKIRQNDCQNAIHIKTSPAGEGQAIVISEVLNSTVYETWVFAKNNELRESFVPKGSKAIEEMSFPIAKIEGFDVSFEEKFGRLKKLTINIQHRYFGKQQNLTLILSLRASNV